MSETTAATTWPEVPIVEVISGLYDGPHATPKPVSEGPVFLGIKNITEDGRLDLSEIRHISEDEFPKWTKRVLPQPGDIVFTYEATLNRYAIIPQGFRGCLGRRLALIRPRLDKIDVRFLFYYFFGEDWRTTVSQNTLSGSTVDRIPLTSFPSFKINLPTLPTQRKIASALSAYDDLIENNTRRIQILEEMAQTIYREWFVNFRFPGHEKVGMVESELGLIPEGWEIKNLFDIAEVTYGFPFKSKLFTEERLGKPVIRIRDIKSQESKTFTPEEAKNKHIVQNGDLLIGMDGDFHMGKWAGGEAYLNQRVVRFRPSNDLPSYYLFLALKSPIQQFGSTIVGTTVAHLSDRDLRTIYLPIPTKDILERMQDTFNPIFELEIGLRLKNRTLRHTRDLLLPKLISGEVDVNGEVEMRSA